MHVITEHEDSAIITIIGNQQLMLCEAMGVFKQDMGAAINAIVKGQNYIKSELLLMKEELSQTKHSCCKYEKNKGDMESQHDEEKTIDEAKQKKEPTDNKKNKNEDIRKKYMETIRVKMKRVIRKPKKT